MRKCAKIMLLNFNTTAVFPHNVKVLESRKITFLKAEKCNWCVCVGNFETRLSVGHCK